jgi:dTDP-4-amino-4,6-dideoxygalactose transaminase
MRNELIPVMKPTLPRVHQYSKYLKKIDSNGIYTNRGPLVRLLEEEYANRLGLLNTDSVVVCSNASIALQGFMQMSKVPIWHVPSFTFPATVHSAIQSGKKVILEDIDLQTWMVPSSVIKDNAIEGLVPVLTFGAGFDASEYLHLENVLIDAAASIGGARFWINDLKENWAAVFSLHATKSFGIGEGGLIVFGSRDNAEKFRSWINFGFNGSRESQITGTNGKLSEVQAAVGLSVLDDWEKEEKELLILRNRVNKVNNALSIKPTPSQLYSDQLISPYWIVYHDKSEVIDDIQRKLFDNSVGTRRWWMSGTHSMPAFKHLKTTHLDNTEFVGARYIGLPFYRGLSNDSIQLIANLIEASMDQ